MDLEDFLRQAAAKRRTVQQPEIQYVQPEVVEATPERRVDSLSQRHLESSQLGEGAASAHDRMEDRVHEKFDHDLSRLEESSPGPEDSPAYKTEDATPYVDEEKRQSPAATIANLLRTRQSIRQAIVLNEILRRPEDRW